MYESLENQFKLYRDRKNNVGKTIGGKIYVHKQYASEVVPSLDIALIAIPNDFPFEVVVYDPKREVIAFVKSPDWNISHEPIVGDRLSVSINNGVASTPKFSKCRNQIYHHKWLFVRDEHEGFCVSDSKQRSIEWKTAAGNEKIASQIGYADFWDGWLASKNLRPRKLTVKSLV